LTIAEYHATPDANVADPDAVQIIRSIPHPNSNHNGGMLAFSPDGYLYASTGDGGGAGGDPEGDAQSLGSLLGKILRLDVDAPAPFVPPSNPFVDGNPATRDEIWSLGLRNPWRFTFDRLNGDLFIGDVGENCWEEIDRQPSTSSGGTNYGWNAVEGNECFDPPSCTPSGGCGQSNYQAPIVVTGHDPECAITGGYRYHGSGSPGLAGRISSETTARGSSAGRPRERAAPGRRRRCSIPTSASPRSARTSRVSSTSRTFSAAGSTASPGSSTRLRRATTSRTATPRTGRSIRAAGASSEASSPNAPSEKARILAPFAPCDLCTVRADVAPAQPGADLILIGWWKNAGTHVELIVSPSRQKVFCRDSWAARSSRSREARARSIPPTGSC
jgi:hypothetical protein